MEWENGLRVIRDIRFDFRKFCVPFVGRLRSQKTNSKTDPFRDVLLESVVVEDHFPSQSTLRLHNALLISFQYGPPEEQRSVKIPVASH